MTKGKRPPRTFNKVDKAKCLAIMGFLSARSLESTMHDPDKARQLLDKALYKRTQEIQKDDGSFKVPAKKQEPEGDHWKKVVKR